MIGTPNEWVVMDVNDRRDRVFCFRHSGGGPIGQRPVGKRLVLTKRQTIQAIIKLAACAQSNGWVIKGTNDDE